MSIFVNSSTTPCRRGVAVSHLLKFREHFIEKPRPISLLEAMAWTLDAKATDPRDKIFACLDYAMMASDLYKSQTTDNLSDLLLPI